MDFALRPGGDAAHPDLSFMCENPILPTKLVQILRGNGSEDSARLLKYLERFCENLKSKHRDIFRTKDRLTNSFLGHRDDVYETMRAMSENPTEDLWKVQSEYLQSNPDKGDWTDIRCFPMIVLEALSLICGHYRYEDLKVLLIKLIAFIIP